MSTTRQRHPLRSAASAFALLLGIGMATSAHAEQISFQFEGYVTTFSNSTAFGGVELNNKVTGTLSYDSSTSPNKTWGSWASTYTLQGGATNLTFDLGNGKQYEDTTLNARVVNGPVYPNASDDTFVINDSYLDPSMYAKNGETQRLHLNFQNTTGINGLSSGQLPSNIALSRLPFSGGSLYVLTGAEPGGDDVYIINRANDAYQSGPYASSYVPSKYVTRYSRSNPNQGYYIPLDEPLPGYYYAGSELERYNTWLAAGNKPMYLDTLGFHITSISAVPEANSVLMLLAGAFVVGLIRRRAV